MKNNNKKLPVPRFEYEGKKLTYPVKKVFFVRAPKKNEEIPLSAWANARRATPAETKRFRKAYENTFGRKPPRRGRPFNGPAKALDIHIKIRPDVLTRVRAEAHRRHMGYQTLINEILLRHAA